jgi:ABC-type Fe3+/spermidine/putrescine transport system ATPase subunit
MLKIEDISKNFGEFAIQSISMEINKGDYFVLLGQSGSGKSVLLQIIAGLIKPDSGQIYIDMLNITHEKIQKRQTGYLFQDYALFPHLTVWENIAYPLRAKRVPKPETERLITEISKSFEIDHLLKKKPEYLSGGEKQRVALARSLVFKPKILLLDEPLSALDTQLRPQIRKLLRDINKAGQTIVHITHDQEEAISLANKVGVISNGNLLQFGSRHDVFQHPRSTYIASFLGIKNFFNCNLVSNGDKKEVIISDLISFYTETEETSGDGFAIIDASTIVLSEKKPDTSMRNCFQGKISEIVPYKNGLEVFMDIGVTICCLISKSSYNFFHLLEGMHIWASFKSNSVRFIKK